MGKRNRLVGSRVTVTLECMVYGGQAMGALPDGRKVFVWNALPGESVVARIIKEKSSYAEAIAEEILEASADRILPREANYLATSPWQMMTYDAEQKHKSAIVRDLFSHGQVSVKLPIGETIHDDRYWQYRNKMEYSFWADDEGVHLALHSRGSHHKQIVEGSQLAHPSIDAAARLLCAKLTAAGIRGSDLKTVIIRASEQGDTVAVLFVKRTDFPHLSKPEALKGLAVHYSNPQSPASVSTQQLYVEGSVELEDQVSSTRLRYDALSFFQVNIPVFRLAIDQMKRWQSYPRLVDMYSGVGSIGLSLADKEAVLVEIDPAAAAMARENASLSPFPVTVMEVASERALDAISADRPVVFDPPRAGLHRQLVEKVLSVLPPTIVYLSCNPATHARDLGLLQGAYVIEEVSVYNFFPRTPHIETLALLRRQ